MSIIKKAPAIKTREVHLEEPVNELLEDYARFIESSPGPRSECGPEEGPLARPGLSQVAGAAPQRS